MIQQLKAWLRKLAASTAEQTVPVEGPRIRVLFGSESGKAKTLAKRSCKLLLSQGYPTEMQELDDVDLNSFSSEERALIICSTHGEGEMPVNAIYFWKDLSAEGMHPLPELRYALLALGDRKYETFCNAGRLIDQRLQELGAQSIVARVDSDVIVEESYREWMTAVVARLNEERGSVTQPQAELPEEETKLCELKLLRTKRLTQERSSKEVWHVAFQTELEYHSGDLLYLQPLNSDAAVEGFLRLCGLEGDQLIQDREGKRRPLSACLKSDVDLTHAGAELLSACKMEAVSAGAYLPELLSPERVQRLGVQPFFNLLLPLQERAYSISSSPLAHPGELHLCVAVPRAGRDGSLSDGVCSSYVVDVLQPGDRVSGRHAENDPFQLPEDDTPILLIGPGTGIAPFRAFIAERAARGILGKTWLFFGDRNEDSDFLYGSELLAWQQEGVLYRLDAAFSRDQVEKRYVTHLLEEAGQELFVWIEQGARIYVCGDAKSMAPAVEACLCRILQSQARLSPEAAEQRIRSLRKEKRYVQDVY